MDMRSFMVTDSSGKKSLTATAFLVGFIVVNLKLLLAGLTIAGVSIGEFSGGEYAAALGALGGIYVLRRKTDPKVSEKKEIK